MITKEIRKKIESATVTILKKGGRGVLVRNSMILTAAHCVNWNCDGEMALGDYYIEEIETIRGKLKVGPLAVEPVTDIAVLGSLDGQTFYHEALDFEDYCEKVKPVRLFLGKLKQFEKFPIYVYTHKRTWIEGEATKWAGEKVSPLIGIDVGENIEGGTSGSPVVNEKGNLVSIISHVGGPAGVSRQGTGPRPHLALPVWISFRIRKGRFDFDEFTEEERKKIINSMKEKSGEAP